MNFTEKQRLSLFFALITTLICDQYQYATSFLLNPTKVISPTSTFDRYAVKTFSSTPFSAGGGNNNNDGKSKTNSRKVKKSVTDRTQEEAISLIQDIIQAAVDAGPQAGPARTLQAYRAFSGTAREFLPRFGRPAPVFSAPKVIRTLFEKLGATYVKLGQVRLLYCVWCCCCYCR